VSLAFGLIGNVIAVGLAAKTFLEAQGWGRVAVLILVGATFLVPRVFPGQTVSTAAFVARMLVGIGCYLWLRHRGEV
jgi:hypothetical protein